MQQPREGAQRVQVLVRPLQGLRARPMGAVGLAVRKPVAAPPVRLQLPPAMGPVT
nr:hypothetical protein [Streptomyces californicus]